MNHFRSTLTLACLATLAAAAGAQGAGITDIMRAGPRPAPTLAAPAAPRAPAPTAQRSAEYIVALVNSEPSTNTDVQARAARIVRENPEAERYPRPELMRLVLERLISERAQMQVVKEQGIKIDDVAVDATGLREIGFDDEGSAEITFVPIRPGEYEFWSPGYENKGLKGKFVVK